MSRLGPEVDTTASESVSLALNTMILALTREFQYCGIVVCYY